ncbi:MAG: class I SAM-dependent methyltransferase, partial [Verrucomicrobia bacterium]|nr:class I SAM-dependent methyltransferase [Verrucomicrobiota bacterium]
MQFKGNTDQSSARYWNDLAELYQKETRISTDDFHYGPLLPGDSTLRLLPGDLCRPDVPVRRLPARLRQSSGVARTSDFIRCLEIGCGAGQNSIFLAKQGARCVAIDISEEQLAHGRKLAAAEKVEVDFRRASMDAMGDLGQFDLIHSTYALPFSADPAKVIASVSAMLKPGGIFLLTTGHPLYAGEWLDIGEGEDGLFLPDYFRPAPDVRMSLDDKTMSAAHYWPVSTVAEWLFSAGLAIER